MLNNKPLTPAGALPNIDTGLAGHLTEGLLDTLAPQFGDTPEKQAARNAAILVALQGLGAGTALEAMLAIQAIAAHHGVMRCLNRAMNDNNGHGSPRGDRAHRNATAMMRSFLAIVRMLGQMQAARAKQEEEAEPDRATRRQEPMHREAPAKPAAPARQDPMQREPDGLTEAEHYAVHHPYEAAAIRAARGNTEGLAIEPISPALARAVASGTGPIFTALDTAIATEKALAAR